MKPKSLVEFRPGSIWINGQPQILLTSSLFYFRIPAFEWAHRMRNLRRLGYNAIDVYFPWNYHELKPDWWDFSGERDVIEFLRLAKEEGLWVVARPGPYICSEWDGGALPAHLFVDTELRIRDYSNPYIKAALNWYDHIMPILAEKQVDRSGSVVMVQIENELDFFHCSDRGGMMTALRDRALAHGISVPLVACAGQGDIREALGDLEGVVPVYNVYFDCQDPNIEDRIRHYDRLMRDQGYPLCITETNRSHTDLRRLLAGGAKLLGPYLQTGGTNFGFTTSVTNWGEPLAFMTSHYDFGGMISPGGKVRPDGHEAIILTKMLNALGPTIALSTAIQKPPMPVYGLEGQALALDGGGWLVGLSNPGIEDVKVLIGESSFQFPEKTELIVRTNTCPYILLDFPLTSWNVDGKIIYSTAEMVEFLKCDNGIDLTFLLNDSAEILVDLPGYSIMENQGWQTESSQKGLQLWIEHGLTAKLVLHTSNGQRVTIKGVNHNNFADFKNVGLNEWELVHTVLESEGDKLPDLEWRMLPIQPCGEEWLTLARQCNIGENHFEQNEIYRGFGWYHTTFQADQEINGFLIRSGADVLSLYKDGTFLGTFVPGGGDAYVPLPREHRSLGNSKMVIRTEIWGHANFDDQRLPALRIKSMRGMRGLTGIRKIENHTPNWFYQHNVQYPAENMDPYWPLLYFGGWSSIDEPSIGVYYKSIVFEEGLDTRVLYFPGLQINAEVIIKGQYIGKVNPFNPFVDITSYSKPGESATIAIFVNQAFRRNAGQVVLYQGNSIDGWWLKGWDESALANQAALVGLSGNLANFPVNLMPGEMAWLNADLPISNAWETSWGLKLTGHGIKVTAWLGEHLVGRIWLPSSMRPKMAGGLDDRMVLPAKWLREADGNLHLLLESVNTESPSELQKIEFTMEI